MLCIDNDLKYEQERLETFINWPVSNPKPKELVTNGFFYLKKGIECACAFCYVYVNSWDDILNDDDYFNEDIILILNNNTIKLSEFHRRISPKCPFLKGEPVGNIPIEFSSYLIEPKYIKYNKDLEFELDQKNKLPKGILSHKTPHHEKYSEVRVRLSSFKDSWPLSIKHPSPKELAQAGFFYKKPPRGDEVICFYCNMHFRNWKEGHDPWIEHGRWSTQCYYILIMKGPDFIKNIRSSTITKYPPKIFSNDIIMQMMNKLDILVTLSKSYKRDIIKRVFKDVVILYGRSFKSYDQAIAFITRYLYFNQKKFKRIKIIEENNQNEKDEVGNICLTSMNNDTVTLTRTYNEPNTTTYCISDPKCDQILSFTIKNLGRQQLTVSSDCQHDKNLINTRCNICQDKERCVLILPCQHFCVCELCLLQLSNCPICRNLISHVTKVYFS